ncbi:MAG: hypothetical protein DHS20C14_11050 [Phycisphaeraceae bacterium]|nr:MAG: hypothetical protein DHS20C14_11050 [Phycisphaeraceae bacterium]
MSPVQTLARVADHAPARDHSAFWGEWFRLVGAERPHLTPRTPGADPSDPTATHEFSSFDGTRIGCRLVLPEGPVRAGLVTSHGYDVTTTLEQDGADWKPLVERGVAVLCVRIRGYPGSQLGVGDLTQAHPMGGWFTRGLDADGDAPERTMEWIVPRAVGDLADACRALRNALYGRSPDAKLDTGGNARPPVYLHGESLGAGLATIVAAQLVGRLRHEPMIERLAIGLPSMGDWPWRLEHTSGGTGREVESLLRARPDRAEIIQQRLRLLDTVVHAARVRGPALAKLAERDDVVPAPSAAAVFNALGSDPGLKWRFLVPAGHCEGGLANARRHALFARCLADFFDPDRFATQAMGPWEPVLTDGERGPDGASPRVGAGADDSDAPPPTLFGAGALTPDADAALITAYERAGRTLDALPYTPEFEALLRDAGKASGVTTAPRDALHRLHNLRKAGRLPRLGRATERPPTIEPEQETLLGGLVVDAVGSMGARDRLPHTPEFDAIVERFNLKTGLELSHHDLWRVVAKLAK